MKRKQRAIDESPFGASSHYLLCRDLLKVNPALLLQRAREDYGFVDFMYTLTARSQDGRFIGRRALGNNRKRSG